MNCKIQLSQLRITCIYHRVIKPLIWLIFYIIRCTWWQEIICSSKNWKFLFVCGGIIRIVQRISVCDQAENQCRQKKQCYQFFQSLIPFIKKVKRLFFCVFPYRNLLQFTNIMDTQEDARKYKKILSDSRSFSRLLEGGTTRSQLLGCLQRGLGETRFLRVQSHGSAISLGHLEKKPPKAQNLRRLLIQSELNWITCSSSSRR